MLLDRRQFLKSLGLLGGSALVSCNGAPEEKLYAYLTPPREMVPGVASFFATVCRACPAGCGVFVKTRERRPIKLEGNPAHPINRGVLCARGQAFVQQLYSRHRVRKPLLKRGGVLEEISWDDALAVATKKLSEARKVGLLTGLESGTFEEVAVEFLSSFSEAHFLRYEPVNLASLSKAAELVFSNGEVPFVDLSKTDVLLSLGADFLDAWISPAQHARQWSDRHGYAGGR